MAAGAPQACEVGCRSPAAPPTFSGTFIGVLSGFHCSFTMILPVSEQFHCPLVVAIYAASCNTLAVCSSQVPRHHPSGDSTSRTVVAHVSVSHAVGRYLTHVSHTLLDNTGASIGEPFGARSMLFSFGAPYSVRKALIACRVTLVRFTHCRNVADFRPYANSKS